jgi:hypothetical protein
MMKQPPPEIWDAARDVTGGSQYAAGQAIRDAELTVLRRLLCEIHPRLRESGGEAQYWRDVQAEIEK